MIPSRNLHHYPRYYSHWKAQLSVDERLVTKRPSPIRIYIDINVYTYIRVYISTHYMHVYKSTYK
jgi:hypothetical protein